MSVQKVEIVERKMNTRATSLRSRITDLIAIKKCGSPQEIEAAIAAFDNAVTAFKRSL